MRNLEDIWGDAMKQQNQTIDFVITWVDGSDPAWQAEKARWQKPAEEEACAQVRYRNWDTLHYWFRAVETYAPWVNRVHLITWGHVPAWLNLAHSKLHVVRHEDYIPAEYRPTFSSHPIELNIHRIPGLAEQFVYFCDDFYLGAPCAPEDFFREGMPCDSLSETPLSAGVPSTYNYVRLNDTAFISRHFDRIEVRKKLWKKWFSFRTPKALARNLLTLPLRRREFVGLTVQHLPQAYLKSSFQKVWDLEPALLDATCRRKFRDYRDVSHCIIKHYQLLTGVFYPYDTAAVGYSFGSQWDLKAVQAAIVEKRYKLLCINDNEYMADRFDEAKAALHAAFQTALPQASSFELPGGREASV